MNQPASTAVAELKPARLTVADSGEYSLLLDTAKFEQAYRIAKVFSASQLVPEIFQGSEANCMVAMNMAMRLQIDPMMLMQNMYIVHGKPGMEAKLAIALINSRGPFKGPIQWSFEGAGMDRKCIAYAVHKQTGERCEAECSMQMAKAEGWYDKSGSKWKTIPDMMLRYRSATFLGRLYAPECLMGIATADELADVGVIGSGSTEDTATRTESVKARLGEALAAEAQATPATTPAAVVTIDQDTGEIKDAPKADELKPTVNDALALVRASKFDEAVDMANGLDASAQTEVQNAIAKAKKGAK